MRAYIYMEYCIKNKNFVASHSDKLTYMGRNDFSKPESVRFIYAGSNVTIRFKGTSIGAVISNRMLSDNLMSLGAVVDGKEIKLPFEIRDKEFLLYIAENLEDEEHEVTLFKRQDASHFYEFFGFELNDGARVLDKKAEKALKIECFGDSVSAGAVVEAVDYVASNDPENHRGDFDNAWRSYAMITSRNLGAQINNNAQGGISIFDNTGYYHAPNYIGVETTYNKLSYYPEGPYSDWNFDSYTPDVVLFAVGQNDPHNEGHEDFNIDDPEYRTKWKTAYKKILADLRFHYPEADFVLMLTVLCHAPTWDKALKEIANEMNDDKFHYLKFTRAGKATPGHPRIPEQYEMAEELTAYLHSIL